LYRNTRSISPYVTELFVELVRRAHSSPAARNVYLNPNRADQALVYLKIGFWETAPLLDTIRHIFDAVAKRLATIIMDPKERQQLVSELQNAIGMAEMVYRDEPAEYAKRAKDPIVAHLINCRATHIKTRNSVQVIGHMTN
jgi:hypothetical protein